MAFNLAVASGLAATVTGLLSSDVSIGTLILDDFSEPEKINTGGAQTLATKKLLGGGKRTDAMGPDEHDITFSGLFRGPDAPAKARALDAIRIAGKQVVLSWLSEKRTVVVKNLDLTWTRGGYRIPFTCTCEVIPQPQAPAQPGLLQQLGQDINAATGIGGLASDASAALSKVQAILPIANALTGGSPKFIELTGLVGTASAVAGAGASFGNAQLGTLSTQATAQGTTLPGTDAASAASGIMATLAAAQSSATYGAMADLVGRVTGNLGRVSA